MKRFLSSFTLILAGASAFSAEEPKLQLAAPISDHMVLQHGSKSEVWGSASPKAEITVSFGGGENLKTESGDAGNWSVTLPPQEVDREGRALKVTARLGDRETELTVSDILVGEVWMCSGQSNMVRPVLATDQADEASEVPLIRLFKTAQATAAEPQSDLSGEWTLCTKRTARGFSAVGYFFGRRLSEELDVPIGLIATPWGGKPIEAFTSRETLVRTPEAEALLTYWKGKQEDYDSTVATETYQQKMKQWREAVAEIEESGSKKRPPREPAEPLPPQLDPDAPSTIYNRMIAPWTRHAIAGAIWYQGESNRLRAVQYESLFPALIEDWRGKWGSDFPFYFAQLANFRKDAGEADGESAWAELQNAQRLALEQVGNTGMAVINDIGDPEDIHPGNKKDVGERLARLALERHYGRDVGVASGPLFSGHEIKGDRILTAFEHAGEGLSTRDGESPGGFEVAGENRKFVLAKARLGDDGASVAVWAESVPEPKAVRYAWDPNPAAANLVNSAGLPASVFRTDDWPLSTAGLEAPADSTPAQISNQVEARNQRYRELGWEVLFNGKDLSGWRNPYDHGEAKVVDGEIHLKGDKKFFLVTEESFKNFILIAEVKLPEGKTNSGIMLRANVEPGRVWGYQAEVDGSERRWSGGLYDEGRRKWLWPSQSGNTTDETFLKHEAESQAHFQKPEVRNAFDRDGWNRYKITCEGNRIRIEVNGVVTTDVEDDMDDSGPIGIQHHGEKGKVYRFRRIVLKKL